MHLDSLSPFVRFAKIFSYYPTNEHFVVGSDYRIFCIIEGSVFLKFKDSEFKLTKHSIALIPPGTEYKLVAVEEKSIEILCINFDAVKGEGRPDSTIHPVEAAAFDRLSIFESDLIEELSAPIVSDELGGLVTGLLNIVRENESQRLGWRIKCASELASIIIILVRNNQEEYVKKETRIVSEVREYLQENLADQIDAEALGKRFHYHPNYLNRIFKDNVGQTLHNYIITIRLEQAKQLLASSNLSLEKIAFRCGFKTLSHFSQSFKKSVGYSPKQFRINSEKITI